MAAAHLVPGLQNSFKTIIRDAGWKIGLNKKRVTEAKGCRILVYHGLCTSDPFHINTLFITLKKFEKQLQLFRRYFDVVSMDDVFVNKLNNERFSVCLSFDDGFANNFKYVLPLLEKYEVPACFFITGIREAGYDFLWNDNMAIAGRCGPASFEFSGEEFVKGKHGKYFGQFSNKTLNDSLRETGFEAKSMLIKKLDSIIDFRKHVPEDYWLQMTKEQIRELSLSRWATIGSHSYYHNDLAKLNGEELQKELKESKRYLEEITQKEVISLAFPYGSYSSKVLDEAEKAGYSQLLATESLLPGDEKKAFIKQRLTINPFISPVSQLQATVSGHYR